MAAPSRTPRGAAAARRLTLGLSVVGVVSFALLQGWLACPFAALLGIPCPGCGLTRATLRLLGGDLGGAAREHPLAPLLVPIVAAALSRELMAPIGRAPPRRGPLVWARAGAVLPKVLLALLLLVWVARFCGALGGPAVVTAHRAAHVSRALAPL